MKIPERHVLARNRSPFCPQIGGTQNVRFGAPVKLGFEIFTCLGVYILRTLRVSVFTDWWRRYGAFQGIRFEVSALASRISTKDFVKISSEFVCQLRTVRRFPVILCFPPKAAEIFGQPGRFLKDFFKKMMKNL